MRLLGQTVGWSRNLRFIQLDEDVPSLISAFIKLSKHNNWPQLIMQKIALSADGETCLLFLFPNRLGKKKKLWKGGKKEKTRNPPKVITVWHVKGNSLRYWLLRLSHLRVQTKWIDIRFLVTNVFDNINGAGRVTPFPFYVDNCS